MGHGFPLIQNSKAIIYVYPVTILLNLIQQWKKEFDKAVCTTIIAKSILFKLLFLYVRQK